MTTRAQSRALSMLCRCASCGWNTPDGGWVAGRAHLDECPELAEAKVRGLAPCWALVAGVREVAWTFPGEFGRTVWYWFPPGRWETESV